MHVIIFIHEEKRSIFIAQKYEFKKVSENTINYIVNWQKIITI